MDRRHICFNCTPSTALTIKSSASYAKDFLGLVGSHIYSHAESPWLYAKWSLASSSLEFPITYVLRQLLATPQNTCTYNFGRQPLDFACCWETNISAPSEILCCDQKYCQINARPDRGMLPAYVICLHQWETFVGLQNYVCPRNKIFSFIIVILKNLKEPSGRSIVIHIFK